MIKMSCCFNGIQWGVSDNQLVASLHVYLWFVGGVAQSRGGVWVFVGAKLWLFGTLTGCLVGQTLFTDAVWVGRCVGVMKENAYYVVCI